MGIHCPGWKLPRRLDGLFIESLGDRFSLCQTALEKKWSERKKEKLLSVSLRHRLLLTDTGKKENGEKNVSEIKVLDWTLPANGSEVSTPATGPNQDQPVLDIHPGLGQALGSRGCSWLDWGELARIGRRLGRTDEEGFPTVITAHAVPVCLLITDILIKPSYQDTRFYQSHNQLVRNPESLQRLCIF